MKTFFYTTLKIYCLINVALTGYLLYLTVPEKVAPKRRRKKIVKISK